MKQPPTSMPKYTQAQWRLIKQDLEEHHLATERMGMSPEDRLRWVLSFAALDLGKLRPQEKVALGYDLRQFLPIGWVTHREYSPLPEKQIKRIQKQVARGLSALLSDPRSYLDGAALLGDKTAGWTLPNAKARMVRISPPYSKNSKLTKFSMIWQGQDEETTILWGIADLILKAGERLRACTWEKCKRPFLARKRQEFCAPTCAQNERNEKKATILKGGKHARKHR